MKTVSFYILIVVLTLWSCKTVIEKSEKSEEIKNERIPLVSLPTYTLIDPNDEIVNRYFVRPSNAEFLTQLRDIINE